MEINKEENMKNQLTKLVAILLVLTLLLSMASCTKDEPMETESKTETKTTEKKEETKPKEEVKEEEPITLVMYTSSNVEEFPDGQDENDNIFIDYLREHTGYNLQWMIGPKEDADMKFNLMMSSGDTPDMARLNKSMFTSYATQGLLTPLDAALAETGPYFLSNLDENLWLAVRNSDGESLAIPLPASFTAGTSFAYRKDWLDNLGLPVPKTTDDLVNVLKAIQTAAPAGKDTIPLMASGADSAFGGLGGIVAAYGVNNDDVDENGVFHFTEVTENMRECLIFLADLHDQKLIGNNYAVNKGANINESFSAGLVFMVELGWATARSVDPALVENVPDAIFQYITEPLVGPYGDSGYPQPSPIQTYNVVPIHNASNAVYAVDFLNKFATPEIMTFMTYGPEGEYFEEKDGVFFPKDNSAEIGYQVYYNYWDKPENFFNRVSYKGFGPYFFPIENTATVKNLYNYAPPLDAVDNMSSERNDLMDVYFTKIISGAESIDTFDEFIIEWEDAEGRTAEAAIQEWYDSVK